MPEGVAKNRMTGEKKLG